MGFISNKIFLFIAFFFYFCKKYDSALKYFSRSVKHNEPPNNKIINYNRLVEKTVDKLVEENNISFEKVDVSACNRKSLILATMIFDYGGHTELIINYLKYLHEKFDIYFYLTSISGVPSKSFAPVKSEIIKKYAKEYIEPEIKNTYIENIMNLYNYIINNKITSVDVLVSSYDVIASSVLYLLKKYTNVKILYLNHADHKYSIGICYADYLVTRVKDGKAIVPFLKDYKNLVSLPFLLDNKVKDYDKMLFSDFKSKYNIPDNSFITLTGCNKYKLGDEYFKLIKKILNYNSNIYHILVSSVSEKRKKQLFNKYNFPQNRFIILDFVSDFNFYIQLSDIYVDSFPQGSALTLVDCIKNSRPPVIRVNKDNPQKSFEEYLYNNYELNCYTTDEMYKKVIKLFENKDFYKDIQKEIRNYFIKTYNTDDAIKEYEKYF